MLVTLNALVAFEVIEKVKYLFAASAAAREVVPFQPLEVIPLVTGVAVPIPAPSDTCEKVKPGAVGTVANAVLPFQPA